MRAGPRPQPTAIKIARGNPGQRRLNDHEPQPARATAAAPRDLPPSAQLVWAELAPELARLGLLTVIDRRALATACRLQGLGERFLASVERLEVPTPTPELWAAAKLLERAQMIFLRFGITPAERTRLATVPPALAKTAARTAWEGLLSG